jgi:hypothetical protein
LLRFSGTCRMSILPWRGTNRPVDICKVWEDFTMSRAKQPPQRKHRACAIPLLGAAGLSLSLASGSPAATVGPTAPEITLGEEEISDVTLATFYVFDKENTRIPGLQLAGHGCGGGGGCAHARGCGGCGGGGGCAHARGCGGCSGGCSHGGCKGCRGCSRGCGGCSSVGVWWGGCGGCGGGTCWIWTQWGWVWAC